MWVEGPSAPVGSDGGAATPTRLTELTFTAGAAADAAPSTIRFAGPDLRVGAPGDVALVIGLLPAMRRCEDLVLAQPVDPGLRAASDEVQAILTTWDRALRPSDRWYRRVEVVAPGRGDGHEPSEGRGVVSLFTGGVDSFHTVVRHRDEVDALLYVHGFDVALEDVALRSEVSSHLRAAAADLELPLIEVETDLQGFGERHGVGWPDYHGAALAAVGHLLSHRFHTLLVPATHTYAHLEGLGSHPLLDRLWSTAALRVVHHGADATRPDKLRAIARSEAARQHLRVCWENRGGAYNCGQCEKCIRTGAAIRVAGVEGTFPTIAAPSLLDVARVRATGRGSPWSELHDELAHTGANPRLRWATLIVLARHQLRRWRWTKRWFR